MPSERPADRSAGEVLAFDVYGTLVDPIAISQALERLIPRDAVRVAEAWRQKQLEYSFRLTVMERYQDFEWVTARAFEYALAAAGATLDEAARTGVLAQYNSLAPFPEVGAALDALRAAGRPMVVF